MSQSSAALPFPSALTSGRRSQHHVHVSISEGESVPVAFIQVTWSSQIGKTCASGSIEGATFSTINSNSSFSLFSPSSSHTSTITLCKPLLWKLVVMDDSQPVVVCVRFSSTSASSHQLKIRLFRSFKESSASPERMSISFSRTSYVPSRVVNSPLSFQTLRFANEGARFRTRIRISALVVSLSSSVAMVSIITAPSIEGVKVQVWAAAPSSQRVPGQEIETSAFGVMVSISPWSVASTVIFSPTIIFSGALRLR